jgi:septal ring factor EnvC (AmiA/AmiB activator)
MTAALAEAAGIADCDAALRRLPAAEAELQAAVLGVDREDTQASIERVLRSSFDDLVAEVPGPAVTSLRRQLEGVSAQNRELEARLDGVEHDLAATHRDLSATHDDLLATRNELTATQHELSESLKQLNVLGQSLSWRVTAPLRRARRLVRPRSSR